MRGLFPSQACRLGVCCVEQILCMSCLLRNTARRLVPNVDFGAARKTGGLKPHPSYKVLWLPSQKGGFLVCLQLQSQTFFASGRVNFFGPRPLPLWLPSQLG